MLHLGEYVKMKREAILSFDPWKGVLKMSILGAIIVPHPPVILPAVGKGREQEIASTSAAYRQAAQLPPRTAGRIGAAGIQRRCPERAGTHHVT